MAIVLLSINGVGLGHLSRMVEISQCLYSRGEKPLLLYQGKAFPFKYKPFFKKNIQSLLNADPTYLKLIGTCVNCVCKLSNPRVFIEDTHPARLELHDSISRFIVIRPTTFEYLLKLRERCINTHDGFFIADDPKSPTWPYSSTETESILSWDNFYMIGPIFRKPTPDGIQTVKIKYNWQKEIPIIIFSMGGGGVQIGANDYDVFILESITLANEVRSRMPNARLLFVKGPLFKSTNDLSEIFEIIDVEEDMPALLAIAHTAVIRPGFNTVWECIFSQTPFYYIIGTTFSEPIDDKMTRLSSYGLASNENILNESFRTLYKESCKKINETWSGTPNSTFFETINNAAKKTTTDKIEDCEKQIDNVTLSQITATLLNGVSSIEEPSFFIRVDDVIELTDELDFILSKVHLHKVSTTLELVPYFLKMTEEDILHYDPEFANIVVSQHGYSHLQELKNSPQEKSEFDFSGDNKNEALNDLVKGKELLGKEFPKRFKYGFSAPFNKFPSWLPDQLQENSWKYIMLSQQNYDSPFLAINCWVDIWDWDNNKLKELNVVIDDIVDCVKRDNYFGLILHPVHFRNHSVQHLFISLLEILKKTGFSNYHFTANI